MDAFKAYKFDELSQNPSSMFNYFFVNNDLFGKINDEDMQDMSTQLQSYTQRKERVQYTSVLSILLVDQVLLRVAAPAFRIPYFRPLVFLSKYILGTIAITSLVMNN